MSPSASGAAFKKRVRSPSRCFDLYLLGLVVLAIFTQYSASRCLPKGGLSLSLAPMGSRDVPSL